MTNATSFSRFDATGYLADLGAAAAYFEATMEEDGDDPRPSYFLDTREAVCPDAFVLLRERGLIGSSGPNADLRRVVRSRRDGGQCESLVAPVGPRIVIAKPAIYA